MELSFTVYETTCGNCEAPLVILEPQAEAFRAKVEEDYPNHRVVVGVLSTDNPDDVLLLLRCPSCEFPQAERLKALRGEAGNPENN